MKVTPEKEYLAWIVITQSLKTNIEHRIVAYKTDNGIKYKVIKLNKVLSDEKRIAYEQGVQNYKDLQGE